MTDLTEKLDADLSKRQADNSNKTRDGFSPRCRAIVESQGALITSQRKAGLDTSASEKLLDLFERTQAIFEDDLRAAERNEKSNRYPFEKRARARLTSGTAGLSGDQCARATGAKAATGILPRWLVTCSRRSFVANRMKTC
jgi:hypothetical protein